jgi:hypothetical protein
LSRSVLGGAVDDDHAPRRRAAGALGESLRVVEVAATAGDAPAQRAVERLEGDPGAAGQRPLEPAGGAQDARVESAPTLLADPVGREPLPAALAVEPAPLGGGEVLQRLVRPQRGLRSPAAVADDVDATDRLLEAVNAQPRPHLR